MRNWRGFSVILFLATWPFVWFFSSLYFFGFGGQCASDNCGPEPAAIESVLYFIYMLAPPVTIITTWIAWRLNVAKSKIPK